MGMDLCGNWRKSTPQEIKDKHEYGAWLHYNWTGWSWIISWLEEHGVPIDEFSGMNDGEIISRKTCQIVAETLKAHWEELSEEDKSWLKEHIDVWEWTTRFHQY